MGPENQPRSKPQSHRRMHQPDPRDEAVRAKLEKPVTLTALRGPLEDILEQLANVVDVDMVVDWKGLETIGIERDYEVGLTMRQAIPVREALGLLFEQLSDGDLDIKAGVRNGLLRVGPRHGFEKDLYTEVYDVHEFAGTFPAFAISDDRGYSTRSKPNGGAFGGNHENTQPGNESSESQMENPFADRDDGQPSTHQSVVYLWETGAPDVADDLIDVIHNTVTPEDWAVNGGISSLQLLNGMLIVNHHLEGHREIAELLELLTERQRAMRASVSRIEPPAMLDPVMTALHEHGFRNATLLAPLKVAVGRNGRFDLEGMAAQIDRMLKVHVEGRARQADTGAVELTLQASIGPKVELPGTHRGPEPMFRVNSTVTAPLGDYIVLATSPGATDYGQAIALVVRVDQAD
jgi:hypothetical protein